MGKIYVAVSIETGKAAHGFEDVAKKALTDGVMAPLKKDSGLTTDKKGEGYTLTMKIADMTVDPTGVSCKLGGDLIRYPKKELVSVGSGITGGASGKGSDAKDLIEQCISGVLDSLMPKVIAAMKKAAR